jgi:hypothetical protein
VSAGLVVRGDKAGDALFISGRDIFLTLTVEGTLEDLSRGMSWSVFIFHGSFWDGMNGCRVFGTEEQPSLAHIRQKTCNRKCTDVFSQ